MDEELSKRKGRIEGTDTMRMGNPSVQEDRDDGTRLLYSSEGPQDITLEDINDPSRFYRIRVRDRIVVGRRSGVSEFVIDHDDSISSKHCEIMQKEGKFSVRDLDSLNGTFVNGERINGVSELHNGDMLKLGKNCMIVRI